MSRYAIGIALAVLLAWAKPAWAQGGPPMVTDDPATPGDGHWEINLAAAGSRTAHRWSVDVFDADINYGWGDRIQLKLDVPWSAVRSDDGSWRNGLGAVDAGLKWRFVDAEDRGFALSTYPQYLSAWSAVAKGRGVASPDAEFFLPLEISAGAGGFEFVGELGRNFVEHEEDEWQAGAIVSHPCTENVECLAEVRRTWSANEAQSLVNLGMRWKWNDRLLLLAAAGRQFGARSDSQQRFLFYAGFQILR